MLLHTLRRALLLLPLLLRHGDAFALLRPHHPCTARPSLSLGAAPRIVCGTRDILPIDDTDAYEALIEEATRENRVVVIKFFASWCRACKAMSPKFTRIADDWPDVEFHEIMFDNKCARRCLEHSMAMPPRCHRDGK
jgi:thiol-disulfide isomerase/thioredoxin